MPITHTPFGTIDATPIERYTLRNSAGVSASVIPYGAILTELHVPDRKGNLADVVLGFDNLAGYLPRHPYFGATVGRCANRIGRSQFQIDGRTYQVPANDGPHSLHGGVKGFDKAIWKAQSIEGPETQAVRFVHTSVDGDQGYPGNLGVTVAYTLDNSNRLRIDFTAVTDQPTIVNLTHHSYFNLAGAGRGDVLGHELSIAADRFTPSDEKLIPTGEIRSVSGTALDFTNPTPVGARIASASPQPPGGYDHNFVLNAPGLDGHPQATVHEAGSGRTMELWTTLPGVQFYTGNFLDGSQHGIGGSYGKHAALCLEPQFFPDAPHHPNFPSAILRPGEKYQHSIVYRFSAK